MQYFSLQVTFYYFIPATPFQLGRKESSQIIRADFSKNNDYIRNSDNSNRNTECNLGECCHSIHLLLETNALWAGGFSVKYLGLK